MFDYSRHVTQFARQRRRIGDLAEAAIQDAMAFVGGKGVPVFVLTDFRAGPDPSAPTVSDSLGAAGQATRLRQRLYK